MLTALVPPAWAQKPEPGFAKETLHLIQQRGFFFVMSLPRTWKFETAIRSKIVPLRKIWRPQVRVEHVSG